MYTHEQYFFNRLTDLVNYLLSKKFARDDKLFIIAHTPRQTLDDPRAISTDRYVHYYDVYPVVPVRRVDHHRVILERGDRVENDEGGGGRYKNR